MTNEQKYSAVLRELGELLESKNNIINCQKWEIERLQETLAAAEEEIAQQRAEIEELDAALDAAMKEGAA